MHMFLGLEVLEYLGKRHSSLQTQRRGKGIGHGVGRVSLNRWQITSLLLLFIGMSIRLWASLLSGWFRGWYAWDIDDLNSHGSGLAWEDH